MLTVFVLAVFDELSTTVQYAVAVARSFRLLTVAWKPVVALVPAIAVTVLPPVVVTFQVKLVYVPLPPEPEAVVDVDVDATPAVFRLPDKLVGVADADMPDDVTAFAI